MRCTVPWVVVFWRAGVGTRRGGFGVLGRRSVNSFLTRILGTHDRC